MASVAKKTSENDKSKTSLESEASREGQQVLGNYVIGKTLGEGTFGKVKLAVHIPTGALAS